MRTSRTTLFVLALACAVTLAPSRAADSTPAPPENVIECIGVCDASTAIPIGDDLFIVANDEDNVLRVYHRERGGAPLQLIPLDNFIKPEAKDPEADLEASTAVGDVVYWMSSHGRNKNGKYRESRHRFFATRIKERGGKVAIEPVGKPFSGLVAALDKAPHLQKYRFGSAAELSVNDPASLNIEALAATPEGDLWIGFRSPLAEGDKAIIVPMTNPKDVAAGRAPALGEAIELDLGGLGLRSMEYWPERKVYIIVAGSAGQGNKSRLYTWTGSSADEPVPHDEFHFKGWQPESIAIFPNASNAGVFIVSDDGGEGDCKNLENDSDKQFRAGYVKLRNDN